MSVPRIIIAAIVGTVLWGSVSVRAKERPVRDTSRIREVTSEFGECVAKRSASVGRAVILGNLNNDQIIASAYRLIDGDCLVKANNGIGATMTFSGDLFRYTIAQALVRMDYAEVRAHDFSAIAPLQHLTPDPISPELVGVSSRKARKAAEDFAEAEVVSALSRFGECVCRQGPNDVHALLVSTIGTLQEREAFGKLADPLGNCLSTGQLRFSPEVLRGVLALNFYRLAGPPPGVQVATLKVKS